MKKAKRFDWGGLTDRARGIGVNVVVACLVLLALTYLILAARSMLIPDANIAPRASVAGWLGEEAVTVSATGAAGSATGSGSSTIAVRGHLMAIHLDFTASISTTTDTAITLASPSLAVLTITDSATDAWYYPVVTQTIYSGGTIADWDALPINGPLDIAVSDTTSGTVVIVTFWWGE